MTEQTNPQVAPDPAAANVAQAAPNPAAAQSPAPVQAEGGPPVVDAEAEVNAAKAAKKAAKKAKKAEGAEGDPPKAPRTTLQEANGVTRPADPLSKTGQVWAMADKLSRAAGRPIERKAVIEALKETINLATIATQYGKWRHYNGLKGVKIEAPKPPPVAEQSTAGAAPAEQAQAQPAAQQAAA